jgi:hypothetical protein
MKRTSVAAVLLLVLGLVAGCGGGSSSGAADDSAAAGGPPTNASVEDFCGAFMDLVRQVSEAGDDITDAQAVKLAKQLAGNLADVGTPADMPADARRAFENALEIILSFPDDATRADMTKGALDLTDDQKKDQSALNHYITGTCMGELSGAASGSAAGGSSAG